jgi:hypothetical protein
MTLVYLVCSPDIVISIYNGESVGSSLLAVEPLLRRLEFGGVLVCKR